MSEHPTAKDPLEAKRLGIDLRREADAVIRSGTPTFTADDIPRPPEFSDEALALEFAHHHQRDLRYVALWGKWLRWDGSRWKIDDTLLAYDLVRRICREAAARCPHPRAATAIASSKTVAAVERLAKSDRRLAATADQWDADNWSLNTPQGTVDLRTGTLRSSSPADHNTRLTAVAPGGSCPNFIAFLERITGGDIELQKFLQRAFGYGLSGSTQEQSLLFFYGTGANGKSVLLNTVSGILGEYHRQAPIEMFTASTHQRHETELAGLRGARLVTAVETEEGRRWAEARIKILTGGDKICARFMRQDYFEFTPQFKLVIAGNHKPGLRSVDEAIRRRFNLVPFSVTIPPEQRDQNLTEKLRAEWPGILAWMIEGCREWNCIGLSAPEAVRSATDLYLDAEDALATWMIESCVHDPNAKELSQTLFADWKAWAERTGEQAGDSKRFRERLETRGIIHKRDRTGRAQYIGLKLRCDGDNQTPYWDK